MTLGAHWWSRLKLWRCDKIGQRVKVLGQVYIVGGGHIDIGDDVVIDGREVAVELHVGPKATLTLGSGCILEHGSSIEAQERVDLGPGCRLKPFSKILDNHFHPVAGERHDRPQSKPVTLEAGVEVGERAIVLPGAWLETKVILGPEVVIGRRVKAGLKLVGSPPRVEKTETAA